MSINQDIEIELIETIHQKDKEIKKLEIINKNITRELIARTNRLNEILENIDNEKYYKEFRDCLIPLLKKEYVHVDKIKEIFEIKIHNFNYLADLDDSETMAAIDKYVTDALEATLENLLEDTDTDTIIT